MNTLRLLRRPRRAARTLHPRIPNRPPLSHVVPTFAIRIGRPAARAFRANLAKLDAAVGESLSRVSGQVRPVATVLLPEALHVVACGSPDAVGRLSEDLGRVLEAAEVDAILESGAGDSADPDRLEPLRVSVIRVSSLVGAAGTVLDLPQARGLIGPGRWPYSRAGEA